MPVRVGVMDSTETLSVRVAEEIRAMLARRRITGRALARQLKVSSPWVSDRLTGHTKISLDDLQRIADALEVGIVDLLPTPTRKPRGGSIQAADPLASSARTDQTRPGRAAPILTNPPVRTSIKRPAKPSTAPDRNARPVRLSAPATDGGAR